MSLITCCPACGTLFKVVSDQLKISQGWVRCGHCTEVFDALAHLQPYSAGATEPSPDAGDSIADMLAAQLQAKAVATENTTQIAQGVEGFVPPAGVDSINFALNSIAEPFGKSRPALDGTAGSAAFQAVAQDAVHASGALPGGGFADSASGSARGGATAALQASLEPNLAASLNAPGPEVASPASPAAQPELSPTDALPAMAPPSFVRQAQRAARWRSPWMRLLLASVGLLLLTLLALQWAVQERDRIAATEPRSVPWLQELCQLQGCKLSALRQIESVVVEASSFNKLRSDGKADAFRLAVSLKNTSALAIAAPHIELSLNDAQDQSLLRRVLSPADLGATNSTIAAGAEFAGSLSMQIDSNSLGGNRVSGYRVLAFYP